MQSRKIQLSGFGRNIITLMTGTTIAQAIPIGISPILTRMYTPEDFGLLGIFVAITSIFGAVTNGKYELAIMLPKKDSDAFHIASICFFINLIFSSALLFIVIILGDVIVGLTNSAETEAWLYFIPFSVFFIGLYNQANYLCLRTKRYSEMRNASVFKSLSMAMLQLVLGSIKSGALGLVIGQLTGSVISALKLLKSSNFRILSFNKKRSISLAKKYSEFPKFALISDLLNNVSIQMPLFFLGGFFNSSVAGYYSFCHKIISMPMILIGTAVNQVFFQKASSAHSHGVEISKLTEGTFLKLVYISAIPFSVIYIYSDVIFSFVFGSEWSEAGRYASLLTPWLFLVFVSSPLVSIVSIYGKQRQAMIFNIITIFIRLSALFYGAAIMQDSYITVLLFGLSGVLLWSFWSIYLLNCVNVRFIIVYSKLILSVATPTLLLLILKVHYA